MPSSFRRAVPAGTGLLVPALLLCLLGLTASQAVAQESNPHPALQKQLNRMDFAIVAAGNISDSVSGIEQRDVNPTHTLTIKPSTSIGELYTLRYTVKPYLGYEFNFSSARFTQNFTFNPPLSPNLLQSAQTAVHEVSFGYVAHLPYRPFGVTPYLGAGFGSIKFTPTPYGGQGLPFQYRAVYYYSLGLEDNFPSSHFGFRLGFRQLIYLAPDFLQNYLTITRRERTSQPTIGFFVHF